MTGFIGPATAGNRVAPVELVRIGIMGADGRFSSRGSAGFEGGRRQQGQCGRQGVRFVRVRRGNGRRRLNRHMVTNRRHMVMSRAIELPAAAKCPVSAYQALSNLTTCLSLQVHLLDEV